MKYTSSALVRGLWVAAIASLAAVAHAQTDNNNWVNQLGQPRPEAPARLPGPPGKERAPVQITGGEQQLHFALDPQELTVSPGNVVHYVLIAQAGHGPLNISYESMNCAQGQWRLEAIWDAASKRWMRPQTQAWRTITGTEATRIHSTLFQGDLCENGHVNGDPAAMLEGIARGIHGNRRAH